MKKFIAMLFVTAVCALAGDVTGKYSGTIHNGDPVLIILKQDGAKLTGSGGPSEDQQFPMRNGKVEGDKITFEVVADENRVFKLSFTAKGDVIEGEGIGPDGESMPLKLTRVKS
jgi:hypothetical protein